MGQWDSCPWRPELTPAWPRSCGLPRPPRRGRSCPVRRARTRNGRLPCPATTRHGARSRTARDRGPIARTGRRVTPRAPTGVGRSTDAGERSTEEPRERDPLPRRRRGRPPPRLGRARCSAGGRAQPPRPAARPVEVVAPQWWCSVRTARAGPGRVPRRQEARPLDFLLGHGRGSGARIFSQRPPPRTLAAGHGGWAAANDGGLSGRRTPRTAQGME